MDDCCVLQSRLNTRFMKKLLLTVWVIVFIILPIVSFGQSRQITGTVTQNGQPLSFATVVQKGTTTGVSADASGKFTISVSGTNPTLIISSAGFSTKELELGTANDYTVDLSN